MKDYSYWSVRIPQDARINQASVKELAQRHGFSSVGRFFRNLIERYYADEIGDYAKFAENHAPAHKHSTGKRHV